MQLFLDNLRMNYAVMEDLAMGLELAPAVMKVLAARVKAKPAATHEIPNCFQEESVNLEARAASFVIKPNGTMKILNEEEARNIIPLTQGRETLVAAKLKQLKVGEALVVEAKDWRTKSSPYRVADNIAKRYGWQFEQGRMPDGSGWIFKRTG